MRPVVGIALCAQLLLAAWFLVDRVPGTDAALRGLPLDDAWIHLVYGRALLETGLPAYNPGQLEAGFTSPLQLGVAAFAEALARLGLPVGLAAKLLSLATTLPATVLAARIAARRAGPAAGGLAALLLALSPTVAFAQLSGMEVGLCGSLLLAGWDAADRDRPLPAGLLLAAAFLARPEAVLVLPLFAGRASPLPALAAGGLWAAGNLAISGHPLPTTFYAKSHGFQPGQLPQVAWLLGRAWPWVALGVGPLALGAALLTDARAGRWRELALGLSGLLLLAGVGSSREVAPSDAWFYYLRYLLPAEPLLAVPLAVGSARIADRRLGWLAWLAWAAVLLPLGPALAERRHLYAWNCQNIEESQGRIGRWLREHAAPGDRVAAVDAGLIRYASGLPLRDLVGLNDHALFFSGRRDALLTDPEALAAWMDQEGVRWVHSFPGVVPFTDVDRRPQRFFEIALRVESRPYTLASEGQSVALLLRRR